LPTEGGYYEDCDVQYFLDAMRRFLTLALTVLALAGCRNIFGLDEVVGTWTLLSINGEGLPFLEAETSYETTEIMEGWLHLVYDNTCESGTYRRLTYSNGATHRVDQQLGVYEISGSRVHIYWYQSRPRLPEGSWARAAVEGDTLWLDIGVGDEPATSTLVYLKEAR
jgi:hypothetical protein